MSLFFLDESQICSFSYAIREKKAKSRSEKLERKIGENFSL
jgi:hypothetical protein